MIQEPQVIRVIRISIEFVWVLIRLSFYILRSIFRLVVPPEPKDVSNEIVLITGAGHGIGKELAFRFGGLGATVICVDVNEATNNQTVQDIRRQDGQAQGYKCDVTDRAAVFQLVERVSEEVGDVTILINNAGIMPCKPILKQNEKEIRTMMDINVNANLWMIQAVLPAMIQNSHGHIAAMSSMAGIIALRNLVPYCGSKHAVRGIMKALAVELYDDPIVNGIKFTTIYPHIVDTGLCHNPRIRFPSLLKVVAVDEAAEQIVNAIRRDYEEITIPTSLHYFIRYALNLLPFSAQKVIDEFLNTGVNAHDS